MENVEEVLKQIDETINKPFVTATFGDKWMEHAKKHYDMDIVIGIAWRQGRRAILLEKAVREFASQFKPLSVPILQDKIIEVLKCLYQDLEKQSSTSEQVLETIQSYINSQQSLSVSVPENKKMNEVMVVDEISSWKDVVSQVQAMSSSEAI